MHTIFYHDTETGEKIKVKDMAMKSDAHAKVLEWQCVPNSFYAMDTLDHLDDSDIVKRTNKHYITIEDDEKNVVYGKNRNASITTLAYTIIKEDDFDISIPKTHIEFFTGGKDNISDICEKEGIDTKGVSILFHIDKRELELMTRNTIETSLGYEYSKLKFEKMQMIFDSPYYSQHRQDLEKNTNGQIAVSVMSQLGSEFVDDTIFENTERSFLPNFIHNFHNEKSDSIKMVHYKDHDEFKVLIEAIEEKANNVLGHPPAFYTQEWMNGLVLTARQQILEHDLNRVEDQISPYINSPLIKGPLDTPKTAPTTPKDLNLDTAPTQER